MAHWLLKYEGLFVGSSSALNVFASYKVAKELGPDHTIVTVICDSGQRHTSRLWNVDYIGNHNLHWPNSSALVNFLS